jgi:hypothetical protein
MQASINQDVIRTTKIMRVQLTSIEGYIEYHLEQCRVSQSVVVVVKIEVMQ